MPVSCKGRMLCLMVAIYNFSDEIFGILSLDLPRKKSFFSLKTKLFNCLSLGKKILYKKLEYANDRE